MLELFLREFRAFKTEVMDRIARLEAAVEAAAAPASADAPQPAADPKATKDSAKIGS